MGIHPSLAFLNTRCLIEFEDANALPVVTVGEQRLPVGALMCGAAEAAGGGCFCPGLLARTCWQFLSHAPVAGPTAPVTEPPPPPRSARFTLRLSPKGFTFEVDVQLGSPDCEYLPVKPCEIEELTVPPVEVELLPVMPVEPALLPFLPPEFDTRAPGSLRAQSGWM
jgi:hypothetical protein